MKESIREYFLLYDYSCPECGKIMNLVKDILICPGCGCTFNADDRYDESTDYEEYYPTREEIIGHGDDSDEDYTGEYYDPFFDE